jgi:hypothetical protein
MLQCRELYFYVCNVNQFLVYQAQKDLLHDAHSRISQTGISRAQIVKRLNILGVLWSTCEVIKVNISSSCLCVG